MAKGSGNLRDNPTPRRPQTGYTKYGAQEGTKVGIITIGMTMKAAAAGRLVLCNSKCTARTPLTKHPKQKSQQAGGRLD